MSGIAKNRSHPDFGGDTTCYAQTVSPPFEILTSFLTHRHNAGKGRFADLCTIVYLRDVEGWMTVVIDILVVREVLGADWAYWTHETDWTNRAYQPDETNEVISRPEVLQAGLRGRDAWLRNPVGFARAAETGKQRQTGCQLPVSRAVHGNTVFCMSWEGNVLPNTVKPCVLFQHDFFLHAVCRSAEKYIPLPNNVSWRETSVYTRKY